MTSDTIATEELFIPFGEARAFVVKAGEVLRVQQPEGGGQVGDLNVWSLDDPRERFWGSHTALYHGAHITEGCELVSTWPGERAIMTMTRDTVGRRRTDRDALQHDVLMGRCSQKYRAVRYDDDTPGCQELLAGAIAEHGLTPDHVHDAVNLFMATGVDSADRFFIDVSDAKEGELVELRAEIDCLVAISCCPGGCTAPGARGLQCTILR
jgi:uncharacterized protein